MPDLTKRGFKKPLENEAYDIKVTNFNTELIEIELDKLVLKEDDGKDITVTFTEATEDAELKSKSKLSVLFGLIKKKFNLLLDILNKKADLVDGKVKSNQLPDMDYAPTNHSHSTVNGHTVESNVPSNAKFTDTVYTHPATHPWTMITGVPAATELIAGLARFATPAEVTNGTSGAIIVCPVYLKTELDKKAATSHTHAISNITSLQSTLDTKAVIVMSTSAPSTTLPANVLHCVYS